MLAVSHAARVACCPLVSHGEYADGTIPQVAQSIYNKYPVEHNHQTS